MKSDNLLGGLATSEQFFNRSTDVLTEADSNFRPTDDAWSVANQVAHVARTIDWFVEACERPEGFDMDFAKHAKEAMAVQSLGEARKWLHASYERARQFYGSKNEVELERKLPDGPVMGGAPIADCVTAIIEHTSHHRGALTVYSRLLGKTPSMPYM